MTKPVARKPTANEVDVMPETLHGNEKKDAAIQCYIGLRWFDFHAKQWQVWVRTTSQNKKILRLSAL